MLKRLSIQPEFKLADLWIGLFWKREAEILHIWICLLPALPLHIQITITHTGVRS